MREQYEYRDIFNYLGCHCYSCLQILWWLPLKPHVVCLQAGRHVGKNDIPGSCVFITKWISHCIPLPSLQPQACLHCQRETIWGSLERAVWQWAQITESCLKLRWPFAYWHFVDEDFIPFCQEMKLFHLEIPSVLLVFKPNVWMSLMNLIAKPENQLPKEKENIDWENDEPGPPIMKVKTQQRPKRGEERYQVTFSLGLKL